MGVFEVVTHALASQRFGVEDVPTVGMLIFLEGLLSADNALVLAILVSGLPKHQQRRGLLYGLVGAFVLRGIAIITAAHLMRYWWIEGLGGAYLLYLATRHFIEMARHRGDEHTNTHKLRSFWPTIIIVELTDLAFAIDSILAAVGLVGADESKVWVIYTGGMIGVIMMRFVAGFFLRLLGKFARLEASAYAIIAWISVKLGLGAYAHFCHEYGMTPIAEHLPAWLFWGVMIALFAAGFTKRKPESEEELPTVDPDA